MVVMRAQGLSGRSRPRRSPSCWSLSWRGTGREPGNFASRLAVPVLALYPLSIALVPWTSSSAELSREPRTRRPILRLLYDSTVASLGRLGFATTSPPSRTYSLTSTSAPSPDIPHPPARPPLRTHVIEVSVRLGIVHEHRRISGMTRSAKVPAPTDARVRGTRPHDHETVGLGHRYSPPTPLSRSGSRRVHRRDHVE